MPALIKIPKITPTNADNPSCSSKATDIINKGKARIMPVKGSGNARKIANNKITHAIRMRNRKEVKIPHLGFKILSARLSNGKEYLITLAKSDLASDLLSNILGSHGRFAPTIICKAKTPIGMPKTADMPGKNIGVKFGKVKTRIKIPKPRSPKIVKRSFKEIL